MAKIQKPDLDEATRRIAERMLNTPPKPHSEMKLGKRKAKPSTKANWPEKSLDGGRIGKAVVGFILAAYPQIAPRAALISSSPSHHSRRSSGDVPLDAE
jgi:hypothetical protein